MNTKLALALVGLTLVACDDKPKAASSGSTGATSASAITTTTAAPSASTAPATGSAGSFTTAAPSASAAAPTSTKECVVTVKTPETDKERSIKCEVGGTVTVYIAQEGGTTWGVDAAAEKALGKPKEQTIPGFAGPLPAHELKWTLDAKSSKAGQTHKVTITNTKGKEKKPTGQTFALTIEVIAAT